MVTSAFKAEEEIQAIPIHWLPHDFQWLARFREAADFAPLWRYFAQQHWRCRWCMSWSRCSSARSPGFGFAKYRFPGRTFLFFFVISTLMIPFQILVVPLFIEMKAFGWENSYPGLIIPGMMNAFGVFMMRQYASDLPDELLEAGRIDGAGEFHMFLRIVLPLLLPALTSLAIIVFICGLGHVPLAAGDRAGPQPERAGGRPDELQPAVPARADVGRGDGGLDHRDHPDRLPVRVLPALFHQGPHRRGREGISMRVLVTGSSGLVGAAAVERLRAEGCEVATFDIADGHDILDAAALATAAAGCDAIVHAAGGHNPGAEDLGERFITHNVTGNYNVLAAAQTNSCRRVVTFSSVNAIGIFRGEGIPDYFPIDDDHPTHPPTAYGMAKRLIEELCRCFTLSTGIATICFRPPAVMGPARRARFVAARAVDPAAEWTPFWEYGAFIDTRDVAGAILAALRCPDPGHLTALICAEDVTSPIPIRELAAKLMPQVPWRGPEPSDPWEVPVRCDRARTVLGWRPQYRWREATKR